MTDNTIAVETVERVERNKASRPWSLDEGTSFEIDELHGIQNRIDTAYVPWGTEEPVTELDVVLTVDGRVIERRDMTLDDLAGDVASAVESDSRLAEYVAWDRVSPSAEAAEIDAGHTRMKIAWTEGGDE